MASLLELRDLVLDLGGRRVLDGACLSAAPGEISALVGEHGAGKTSLAEVASGFLRPASGAVVVDGKARPRLGQEEAAALGIRLVRQETPWFDELDVAGNVLAGTSSSPFRFLRPREARDRVAALAGEWGIDLDPAARLRGHRPAEKVLADLLRALLGAPRVLLLDEVLERLGGREKAQATSAVRKFARRGGAVVQISHEVDDVFELADSVSVLRRGRTVFSDAVGRLDKIAVIRMAYTRMAETPPSAPDYSFERLVKYNEAILRDLPVALFVLDAAGNCALANAKARSRFGLSPEAADPRRDAFLGPGNEELAAVLLSAAREGRRVELFGRRIRIKGEATVNDVVACPVLDGRERIGCMVVVEDVGVRESLREKAVLSGNLASLGLLAAGVAHEINNPLDIVGYYLQGIRFATSDAEVLAAVRGVEEEIESVAAIVSNLVLFSAEAPRETEEFDMAAQVRDLVDLVAFSAERNGARIVLEGFPAEGLLVRANRGELRQVFLNIIKNALEAMDAGHGGRGLTVRGFLDRSEGREDCVVRFEDEGPGIEESRLQGIFLPYYTTKGASSHCGLGLSISYGIAKKHGGGISAENRPEGGAAFAVRIPSARRFDDSGNAGL